MKPSTLVHVYDEEWEYMGHMAYQTFLYIWGDTGRNMTAMISHHD
jgi:hypothetical protein